MLPPNPKACYNHLLMNIHPTTTLKYSFHINTPTVIKALPLSNGDIAIRSFWPFGLEQFVVPHRGNFRLRVDLVDHMTSNLCLVPIISHFRL